MHRFVLTAICFVFVLLSYLGYFAFAFLLLTVSHYRFSYPGIKLSPYSYLSYYQLLVCPVLLGLLNLKSYAMVLKLPSKLLCFWLGNQAIK